MKASIVLGIVLGLAWLALWIESRAAVAGLAGGLERASSQDPAVMVLSGALLLIAASLLRRYVA